VIVSKYETNKLTNTAGAVNKENPTIKNITAFGVFKSDGFDFIIVDTSSNRLS